jgi:hypothetical protein
MLHLTTSFLQLLFQNQYILFHPIQTLNFLLLFLFSRATDFQVAGSLPSLSKIQTFPSLPSDPVPGHLTFPLSPPVFATCLIVLH